MLSSSIMPEKYTQSLWDYPELNKWQIHQMWNKKSARRSAYVSAYITTNIWPQAVQVTVFYKTTPNKIDQMNLLITHIDGLKQDCNSSALAIDIINMIKPNTKIVCIFRGTNAETEISSFWRHFRQRQRLFVQAGNQKFAIMATYPFPTFRSDVLHAGIKVYLC